MVNQRQKDRSRYTRIVVHQLNAHAVVRALLRVAFVDCADPLELDVDVLVEHAAPAVGAEPGTLGINGDE